MNMQHRIIHVSSTDEIILVDLCSISEDLTVKVEFLDAAWWQKGELSQEVIKLVVLMLSRTQHCKRCTWFRGQMFVLQIEMDSCAVAGQ